MHKEIFCDVLVVGGGAAGVAAAVGAANEGAKVILAEHNSFLGGKGSAAIVGTVCGLYLRKKSEHTQFVCDGFAKEFATALQIASTSIPQSNSEGLHYLPYQPFMFKTVCDDFLQKSAVEVYLHTTISSCVKTSNSIQSISAIAFDHQVVFKPKTIVDCSGEAIVSQLSSLSIVDDETFQAAAQVLTLHHVAADKEANLSLLLLREITKAVDSGQLPKELSRTSIVPGSLHQNKLMLKIALPFLITHQLNAVSQVETEARKLVVLFFNFLKSNISAFNAAQLGEVAVEAGIRTGRRPIGKYQLTEDDVLTCRKFATGIANGAWPIEFWEPGKKVKMSYFKEADYYQIPADSLISGEVNNLFFAGRNISADKQAIASARVIGTCLQSGYAAGVLAGGQVKGSKQMDLISQIRNKQIT
ncbi:MAG: FAD-dependent oxidoreductase [Bacteroidetes bacterium]|nr:FAD-dependent oxidoreductase [Bacteroidota bacterium]